MLPKNTINISYQTKTNKVSYWKRKTLIKTPWKKQDDLPLKIKEPKKRNERISTCIHNSLIEKIDLQNSLRKLIFRIQTYSSCVYNCTNRKRKRQIQFSGKSNVSTIEIKEEITLISKYRGSCATAVCYKSWGTAFIY